MDTPPLTPVSFYGLQSKRRNLSIKQSLESRSKRLRKEKIPNTYHSRLLGPSARWQIFYRQQEALDFVRDLNEDLHVFAFESHHPDKQSGQRQFLAATYPVFWHYYIQLEQSQRHHYEIIPEGCACKLYFDLEFRTSANQCADGVSMVDTLIKYVSCWLKELYGVHCTRDQVLELTASMETKFSRHLIYQLEDCVFTDNINAGNFVRAIFSQLEMYLYTAEKGQTDSGVNKIQQSPVQHNRDDSVDHCHKELPCNTSSETVSSAERENVCGAVDVAAGVEQCEGLADHQERTELCGMGSVTGKPEDRIGKEKVVSVESGKRCGTGSYRKPPHADDSAAGSSVTDLLGKGYKFLHVNLSAAAQEHRLHAAQVQSQTAAKVQNKYSFQSGNRLCYSPSVSGERPQKNKQKARPASTESDQMDESTVVKGKAEVPISVKLKGGQQLMEDKVKRLCDKVCQQFEVSALRSLFVKATDNKDTCFADLGVYTKNRNFRLYKSCKLGKTTAFTVAEQNTFMADDMKQAKLGDREIFLASLITNVRDSSKGLVFEGRTSIPQLVCRQRTSGAFTQTDGEHMEGGGKSPYPEVDDFISSQLSEKGGAIRRWVYFPAAEILSYDIIGYRFCYNVERQHRSNNIKLVADLQQGVWYQKCYDPDCQAVNFKSQDFALPAEVLPAHYIADADDFEDMDDDSMDDDDDEDCLLAVQAVEQGLAAVTNSTKT